MAKKSQKGFTLIELLVVISIISLLASVVLMSLNGARVKARDAKRKSDLHQIQQALALYYYDNNQYPNCGYWVYSTDADWNTTGCLISYLRPYMPTLPVDPVNSTSSSNGPWTTGYYGYAYGYINSVQDYDLVTQLENTNDMSACQIRQWIYHNPGTIWCGVYSIYLYADH